MDKGSSRNSRDDDVGSVGPVHSEHNYVPTTDDLNDNGRMSEAGGSINYVSVNRNSVLEPCAQSEGSSSNFADALAERAQSVKKYASEVSDRISEKYSELTERIRAFIGSQD